MALPLRSKVSLVWRMFRDPDVPIIAEDGAAGDRRVPGVSVRRRSRTSSRVLGQLDDLLVIAVGLGLFLWLTPRPVLEEHLEALE